MNSTRVSLRLDKKRGRKENSENNWNFSKNASRKVQIRRPIVLCSVDVVHFHAFNLNQNAKDIWMVHF